MINVSNILKDYSVRRKGNPYGRRRSVPEKKTTKESRQRRDSVLGSTITDRKRKRTKSQPAKSTETQSEGKQHNQLRKIFLLCE